MPQDTDGVAPNTPYVTPRLETCYAGLALQGEVAAAAEAAVQQSTGGFSEPGTEGGVFTGLLQLDASGVMLGAATAPPDSIPSLMTAPADVTALSICCWLKSSCCIRTVSLSRT